MYEIELLSVTVIVRNRAFQVVYDMAEFHEILLYPIPPCT